MSRKVRSLVFLAFVAIALLTGSAQADIKAGLVGHWPLNGDGIDASIAGNNGTLVGNVRAAPDRYAVSNATLSFPGKAESYVEIGVPAELQMSGAMTVTAWVYLNGTNASNGRIITALGATDAGAWDLGVEVDAGGVANALIFQVAGSSTESIRLSAEFPLPTDRWVHIAAIFRPQAFIEIYVDGQSWARGIDDIPDEQVNDSGAPILIGSRSDCSDCGWDGRLDEIRIYDRHINQVEIWQIMRAGVGCSSAPKPPNYAKHVPRDVTLRWTAGPFAKTHDVYLGTSRTDVNDASRTDQRGVLAARGVMATKYAPSSPLEFGRTYYWRVDEVNVSWDNTIYKGEVWTFTVESVAPPVEGIIIATSNLSSVDGARPRNTINGSGLNANDQHSTSPADMWLGQSDGTAPVVLEYEFDTIHKLHEMLVWNYNATDGPGVAAGLRDVTIEYSTDGVTWSTLRDAELAQATGTSDYAANTTISLAGVAARFIRLTIHSNWGATDLYGLSEIRFHQIPTRARNPEPADGEIGVDLNVSLSWSAGREATLHDVHFSDSAPLVATGVALKDSVTVNRYNLRPLDFGTAYYWRIDERNETKDPGLWQGFIWTFTTREFAVVDDFETYTDDSGRRIYQIWKDGYDNGTGSVVGYLEAPFAEQVLIHGGGQSMPLSYDNTQTPFYSEAVRNIAFEQDWLEGEANTLRLFVRGQADNDPDPLYIGIEDTGGRLAIVTHPDPTVVTRETWQEWTIPFSDLENVRLAGVKIIYLGVGNRENPALGGSGRIFIDDIEFGKPIGGQGPSRF